MRTDHNSLLLLLNWMSPAFPIGAFAYSHGLEQAIADGRLRNAEDVEIWISDLLVRGSGWNDAIFFASCWRQTPASLNEMALALAASAERYQETTQLGRNFAIAASVWTNTAPPAQTLAYPVAAGQACHAMGVLQEESLLAFLQGFCAALVSVAVRLVPLGQTAGLQILRKLTPHISATVRRAQSASLDDLGGPCFAAEIASMQHETLEPRIFRT